MGGAIERIVILPLVRGQGEHERKEEARQLLSGLLAFDTAKACCFKPEDQQKRTRARDGIPDERALLLQPLQMFLNEADTSGRR